MYIRLVCLWDYSVLFLCISFALAAAVEMCVALLVDLGLLAYTLVQF